MDSRFQESAASRGLLFCMPSARSYESGTTGLTAFGRSDMLGTSPVCSSYEKA